MGLIFVCFIVLAYYTTSKTTIMHNSAMQSIANPNVVLAITPLRDQSNMYLHSHGINQLPQMMQRSGASLPRNLVDCPPQGSS